MKYRLTPDGKPNRVPPLPQCPASIATSHGAAEPGDGGGSRRRAGGAASTCRYRILWPATGCALAAAAAACAQSSARRMLECGATRDAAAAAAAGAPCWKLLG